MFSFDDIDGILEKNSPQPAGDKKDGWFRLKVGMNRIRIVSKYDVIKQHWNDALGRSVACVGIDKGCSYHRDGKNDGSLEFMMWIIDREDGKPKIAFLNNTVMKAIGDLKKNPEYGFTTDFPQYDVLVNKADAGEKVGRDGRTMKSYRYTVTPSRNETPLTQEEQDIVSKLNDISSVIQKMKDKVLGVSKPQFPAQKKDDTWEIPVNTDVFG